MKPHSIKEVKKLIDDQLTRATLDNFSAKVLINFALINVAAIAGVLSIPELEPVLWPFMVGIVASILAQLLWYADLAFEYGFGKAHNPRVKNLGSFISGVIILLGYLSASGIVCGGFMILGFSNLVAIFGGLIVTFVPIFLLIYATICEKRFRAKST